MIIMKTSRKKISKEKRGIVVFSTNVFIGECQGLLYPCSVTALLLSDKSVTNFSGAYKSFKQSHIKRIDIPKLGKGYSGQSAEINLVDHAVYFFFIGLYLPWFMIKNDTFIFVTPPFFNTIFIPVLKLFNKRVILLVYDAQIALAKSYSKKPSLLRRVAIHFAGWLETFAVKRADAVFAVSKYLVRNYKKLNNNVFLWPNGADVDHISKIKAKRSFEGFTIGYMGGFERFRGLDLLVESFKLLKKKVPEANLLLIGDGPDLGRVKKIAGNFPDIHFMGYVEHDKAIGLIKGVDVATLPARDVITSKTISTIKGYEYIAAQVPQVVTDTGYWVDFISNLDVGLIVKDDKVALADAFFKLYSDKSLYSRLKHNCHDRKSEIDFRELKRGYVDFVMGR
jgi:glycosyltransferase involved in cell wall biosynthesis